MTQHCTDAEVKAAVDAILTQYVGPGTEEREIAEADARAVLDAVAPAIAARALREFASAMERPDWTHRDDWGVRCAYSFEVTSRADEIERGAL